MPAFKYNIVIEQGSIFKKTFVWTLPSGVQNLTGWTARMQVRRKVSDPVVLVELTTENGGIELGGVEGTVYLEIDAVTTGGLTEMNNGRYDLELVSGSEPVRLVEGEVRVTPQVTR